MNPALTHIREILTHIEDEIRWTIIGQDHLIRRIIIALFAWGHVLIEWVPGLGKTLTIKTLAHVLGYQFKRISFTPDLLPSDLTGTEIYRADTGKFELRKWPIFTEILLADEINRTPPKVQSALLEAMEEGHVTIGDTTLPLSPSFFVLATENPIEHEWTYPLPEAELDRFLMKITLTYPNPEDEKRIWQQDWAISAKKRTKDEIPTSIDLIEIREYIAKSIRVDEKIYDYVSDILELTRSRHREGKGESEWNEERGHPGVWSDPENQQWRQNNNRNPSLAHNAKTEKSLTSLISYWASTRAGLALIRTARVLALLEGRDYVLPEDIKSLAHEVLRHRILLSYEARNTWRDTENIITEILESVRVI